MPFDRRGKPVSADPGWEDRTATTAPGPRRRPDAGPIAGPSPRLADPVPRFYGVPERPDATIGLLRRRPPAGSPRPFFFLGSQGLLHGAQAADPFVNERSEERRVGKGCRT